MKVIGISSEGYSKSYVAIVTHDELRRLMDKAGYQRRNELAELKVGDVFDLGQGHNFRDQIVDATQKMAEAYERFAKVAPIAAEFAGIVAAKQEAQPDA